MSSPSAATLSDENSRPNTPSLVPALSTTERYALLVETAEMLIGSADPQPVVEQLCRRVMRALGCDVFFNFVATEGGDRLRLNACAGIARSEAAALKFLDYGSAVCGCVARDGVCILAEDVQNSKTEREALIRRLGLGVYCCHPLINGGRVIGTLSFGSRTRTTFNPADIELMRAVTNQVAAAMQRLRAEHALRESERQFRALADSLPTLAFWANADGAIMWYNQRWYEFTGRSHEELSGWGWQSVHAPDRLPTVLQRWRDSLAAGSAFEMEFPLRNARGEYHWFLTRVVPVKDSDGRVQRWFGTTTDVTGMRDAHEALARHKEELERAVTELARQKHDLAHAEATFRCTFENAAVGIAHVSPENRFLRVNQTLAAITGYPHDELLRKTFVEITHPDDLAADLELTRRLAAGELDTYSLEKRYIRGDGSPVWVNLTASTVRHADGTICYFIAVVEDISRRRTAEAQLMEAQQRLQQHASELEIAVAERTAQLQDVVQELSSFSYTVSHDLRAPLRTISGFADILAEDYATALPDDAKSYLQRITRAARKMDVLITDVLAYSRISRAELHFEDVDPESLIRDLVESRFPEAASVIRVVSPLPTVRASRTALDQCFGNLISNALKFVRPGVTPEVTVHGEALGTAVRLWVEDNGIGFSPDHREKVWTMFERLNASTEGSGVGLAIVRRAIDRMGGRVGVETTPGIGSRFWIELPPAKGIPE